MTKNNMARSGVVLALAVISTTLSFPMVLGLFDVWFWVMLDMQFSFISWDFGKAAGTFVLALLSLLVFSIAMDISKSTREAAESEGEPQPDDSAARKET